MKIRNFGLEAVCAVALLAGGTAHGQSAAPEVSLDEVIVTAARREEKVHDVALSITALSGDDLARRQESGYTEFAAQVPGMSLQAVDAGTNRVILRGQNVGSTGATIATAVDDIPFFMSSAQADGAYFSANVDTYDLKRIEVLRGPQGTLYGAAAEGGLIKYVTNPPNLKAYEGAIAGGGETVADGGSAGFVRGLVNVPFWDNKAAVRISAVEQGLPGWIDNPMTGQHDVNHGDRYSLRGSLLVEPTSDFKIRLTAFDQGLTVHGDNYVQVVGAALTPATPPPNQFDQVNGLSHASAAGHNIDHNLTYYALALDYDFKVATLMSATSYGEIKQRTKGDFSDLNLAPGLSYAAALSPIYGEPILVTGNVLEYVHKFNQELRLTSNPGSTVFGSPLDWLVGGFFTRESTLLDQPYDARSAADLSATLAPPLGGAVISADYKETAFFADVTYHFTTAFDFELGGRTTRVKQNQQTTYLCCIFYGPGTVFDNLESSESSTTWSAAPRWHINPDTMVYFRYATGFRPGGPNIPTPTLSTPPTFLPDSTRNYEVGLRADLFNKQFTIDVAVFDIKWKDIQILGFVDTASGPVGINGNSGSAESKGIEWNFLWQPVAGLTVGVLGAYTDAKLKADAPGLGAKSGDELPYVPDVSSTLNVDYTWKAFGNYSAIVGGSWVYTGTRYTSFSPSVDVIEPHVKLPTYNTLDLRAGLESGRYSFELYGHNLSNERGITEYQNQGGANQTGRATFIQPRTFGVQLGAKF